MVMESKRGTLDASDVTPEMRANMNKYVLASRLKKSARPVEQPLSNLEQHLVMINELAE